MYTLKLGGFVYIKPKATLKTAKNGDPENLLAGAVLWRFMVRALTQTCAIGSHEYCSRSYCGCYCHGDKNSQFGINDMELRIKKARDGEPEQRIWQHADNRRY